LACGAKNENLVKRKDAAPHENSVQKQALLGDFDIFE
jgi:hypothetical protein